ncbi:MAG: hypothetical protein KDC35_08790 [Acidobacteria bacterium]|nr:hypothetical protein [Acidobacteriota bacterium]
MTLLFFVMAWQLNEPETVQDVLETQAETWWDYEAGEIKPIDPPKTKSRPPFRTNGPSLGTWAFELGKIAAVIIVLALLTVIVLTLVRARRLVEVDSSSEQEREFAKLRKHLLPKDLQHETGDFLALARQARKEGRIRDAFAYLFGHVLLTLDARQLIDLDPGKTNYAYLRELKEGAAKGYFQELVPAFEVHFFGPNPNDEALWDERYKAFRQLERGLGE